jgi:phage shock protein A
MGVAFRKSRMISFRLTPTEYQRFQEMCATQGLRSISDLARTAVQKLIAVENQADPLTYEVRDLREQVRSLSLALDRISERVDERTEEMHRAK